MTRFCICLLMAATAVNALPAQDTPAKEAAPPASAASEDMNKLLQEIQVSFGKQDYYATLKLLDKADALAPDSPILPNVRGSVYTSMRDFAKARESFLLSESRMPQAFEPKFNLSELLYAEEKYPEADAAFTKLLKDFPKLREEVRHLTQFKVAVCRLKQNHTAEAEEMAKNFTFMDDTPAYYYTKAAFSFQKGDNEDAKSWMSKAVRIFKRQQNVPYIDTLMEARWVQSLSVPKDEPAPAEAK